MIGSIFSFVQYFHQFTFLSLLSNREDLNVQLDDDIILNKRTGLDEAYDELAISNQLDPLHIESGVIF